MVDVVIEMKSFRSETTALVKSHEKLEDIMKIVKSLKAPCILIKKVLLEQFKKKLKNKWVDFLECYLVY